MKLKFAAVSIFLIGAVATLFIPGAMGGLLQDSSRSPLVSGALNNVIIDGQSLPFGEIGNQLDGINTYLEYAGSFVGIMLWLILTGIVLLLANKTPTA